MIGKFTLPSLLFCLLFIPVVHAGTVSFQYNTLDQLVQMDQLDSTAIVYGYDDNGNRKTKTVTLADNDNDGLVNGLENRICTDQYDADSDDDGLADGTEDANHNGIREVTETDPCNRDTDGDGIQDGTESGITEGVADPDGTEPMTGTDMTIFQPDLDPSTQTDALRADSDGDGMSDGEEDANHNGRVDAGETDPAVSDRVIITPVLFLLLDGQ